MIASRFLAVALAVGLSAELIASCKTSSSTTGSSSASSTSGVGGAGGSGGAPTVVAASSSSGAGGSADAGPFMCPTMYTTIPVGPCSLLDQDCAAGETCVPSNDGTAWSTACIGTPGLKTAGEDCYTNDDCEEKLVCIGLVPPLPGKCAKYCCNDGTNRPCNGGTCNNVESYDQGITAYTCNYGKQCELLTAGACPTGYGCHLDTAAGQGIAICFEPSDTPAPDLGTCSHINDCGNMQQCYTAPNGGFCLYYCSLTGPKTTEAPGLGGCPNGQTCEASYGGSAISLGVSNVGLCIPTGGLVAGTSSSSAGSSGTTGASSSSGAASSSSSSSSGAASSSSSSSSSSGASSSGTGSSSSGSPSDAGPDDAPSD